MVELSTITFTFATRCGYVQIRQCNSGIASNITRSWYSMASLRWGDSSVLFLCVHPSANCSDDNPSRTNIPYVWPCIPIYIYIHIYIYIETFLYIYIFMRSFCSRLFHFFFVATWRSIYGRAENGLSACTLMVANHLPTTCLYVQKNYATAGLLC